MIIHDCEQRSEEWHQLRLGRVTGTRIAELAGGKPETVEKLCRKIVSERLTGVTSERGFSNEAMEQGILLEDEARAAYEMVQKVHIREVGFISKDDLTGCSPDGLVDDNGMVELKCPLQHTHLGYLMAKKGKAHRGYRWQLQGQLWVYGGEYVDFVSYCPHYDGDMRMLIERVLPDEDDQAKITERAIYCRERIEEIPREIQ